MANSKKTTYHFSRPPKAGKRSRQDRRWTLLFIGNHGRTITLKRFKGIVILSIAVLAVSLAISAGLLVWNQKMMMDRHGLQDDLKNLNERIDALRHEKDILMTRLVLAESRVQESADVKTASREAENVAEEQPPPAAGDDKPMEVATVQKESPAPPQVAAQPDSAPIDFDLSVAIENFQILDHSEDQRLKVQFKIKNTSPNSQRVSGHTIIVLKGAQTDWLPIPWMPLVDGRPTGKQRGHSFGINYFKTMRLSTRSPKYPEKYEIASVYVFTREGELLLEKEYPVNLPPSKPQYAKPLPGSHAVPSETAQSPSAPAAAPEASSTPSSLKDAFNEALKDTPPPHVTED